MVAKEIAVKRYVVKLSAEERELVTTLIQGWQAPGAKVDQGLYLIEGRCR